MVIEPARLALTAGGIPYSADFDDVYHSVAGALGQAEHVFLAGNDLPQRWQRKEHHVIVETGFGLGLNFLATWAAWQRDPRRCQRLHFISFELHPFQRGDLQQLHASWPQLSQLSAELLAQWPVLAAGMHRLHLDQEQVTLDLYFGDATTGLAELVGQADSFFIDGFAPAKNPQLWSPRLCHLLASRAAQGATLATWSVAGSVRQHLQRAGFELQKAAGYGGKREMLRGRLRPRAAGFRPRELDHVNLAQPAADCRHAIVIGAGLAGCAVSERLAARGWKVELIDAALHAAHAASGNHAGVLRPQPSVDDNPLSQLSRAGSLYAWRHIAQLQAAGLGVQAEACGVLQVARDGRQAARMQAAATALALPAEHLRWVDADAARTLADWPLMQGGWHFADSGWVQPPSLCTANLQRQPEAIRCLFGRPVAALQHSAGYWQALDRHGAVIARAPTLILAAGTGINALAAMTDCSLSVPIRSARGQVSHFVADAGSAPRIVICGQGYVTPAINGVRYVGASFAADDPAPQLRREDHLGNLVRADAMLPGYRAALARLADEQVPDGRVGFRPVSPDRLPLIGPLPGTDNAWMIGGFGARGLAWSQLGAEILASLVAGQGLPLERKLLARLLPARFSLRQQTP